MFLAALGLLIGLTGAITAQPAAKPSADAATVAKDNNVFAFDLYGHLSKEDGNLFVSPYSISSALAMTYAGAKGQTAEQMAQTMHFGLPPEKLHAAFAELIKHMNAEGKDRPYQLSVANSLWGQKNYSWTPGFLDLLNKNYGAGFQEVDFVKATEQARQIINAWVEKQTNDKNKELLKPG